MKTKFLLPVLAMIFAVGMSFTTLESANNPNMDYYSNNGNLLPIGQELTCGQVVQFAKFSLKRMDQYMMFSTVKPQLYEKLATVL